MVGNYKSTHRKRNLRIKLVTYCKFLWRIDVLSTIGVGKFQANKSENFQIIAKLKISIRHLKFSFQFFFFFVCINVMKLNLLLEITCLGRKHFPHHVGDFIFYNRSTM